MGEQSKSSLLSLYRSWFPQTAATVEERIGAIDYLIQQAPDAAFTLLDGLTGSGPDFTSHTARPKWRDDDAGAGYGATGLERHTMRVAAIDRQIEMSRGHALRIAQLIPKYAILDAPRQHHVIELLSECATLSDADKEALRAALRRKLHWHRNYDELGEEALSALLDPLEAAYVALEPADHIVRNAWLFKNGWVELPVRSRGEANDTGERQGTIAARAALKDIFETNGWPGILELAEVCGDAWTIGCHLPHIGVPGDGLYRWIVEQAGNLNRGEAGTTLAAAIICCTPADQREAALDTIFAAAPANDRSADWLARLLVLCPHDPAIWRRAQVIGQTEHYWSNCTSNLWLDDPADMERALRKLVEHGRPVSALNACHTKFSAYDPELIMKMLEGVLKGHELNQGQMPQSYVFQHAIDFIEEAGTIGEPRLVQLEFALIRAFGFQGEHHAKTLYRVLMAKPEIFVELLCIVYKPRNGPPREVDEAQKGAAENAWHILHACRRQPGTRSDGTIDADQATSFVEEARRAATEQDRLTVCDITLGEVLAHAPQGADGIWPGESARSLLEGFGSEDMLRGFYTGSINKRGISSRGAYEGGDQERELASYFRSNALALEATHPQLAATVHELAKSYDRHGLSEDLDAQLRIEGR